MYPKIRPEPVCMCVNNKSFAIPRKSLASAYAGACAAKEEILFESNPLTSTGETFRSRYEKNMPACIVAANNVGLSAVLETVEYWRPRKELDTMLKDRAEHADNPFYPFFEED